MGGLGIWGCLVAISMTRFVRSVTITISSCHWFVKAFNSMTHLRKTDRNMSELKPPFDICLPKITDEIVSFLRHGAGRWEWTQEAVDFAAAIVRPQIQARIAALEAENARLKAALCMIYDKWEDGTSCYEDPEDYTGHLGNAVKLTNDEEAQILALIPSQRSAPETSMDVGRPGGDKTCEVTYRQGPNGIVEILSEKCYEQKTGAKHE